MGEARKQRGNEREEVDTSKWTIISQDCLIASDRNPTQNKLSKN